MIIVKLPFFAFQTTLVKLNWFAQELKTLVFKQGFSAEEGSPVSNDGRGLKLSGVGGFAAFHRGSPVSNDGRGLKLLGYSRWIVKQAGSPVSNDGRGLKHVD